MGETNLSSLSKIGKKYLFCCCFEFEIYLSVILSWFWEDAGKAACRHLERVLLFSCTHPLCLYEVYLPHREKEWGPGSCRRTTDKHSQHSGGQLRGFLLAASVHISSITAASKYLLYLRTSAMWEVSAFMWSLVPIQRTSHCGSVVIWTSTALYKFIKPVIVVNWA